MGDTWDIEEASSWVIKNSQCKNKYSVSKCGSTQILGGYECLAKDASISKNFTLPHHWKIQIKVTFWLIDSWDDEDLVMSLGNIKIQERRKHASSDLPLCGASSNWLGGNKEAYYDRKYDKSLENGPHFERSIYAYFSSNLDGKADDESFGINNFQLFIDPCNPTCDKCINGPESFNCLNCWQNASFLKFSDEKQMCECPKGSQNEYVIIDKNGACPPTCTLKFKEAGFCKCNNGYYTLSKDVPCNDPVCTECIKCDSTCKLCSGPGPSACVTCEKDLFKQLYTSPDVPSNHPKYGQSLCQKDCLNESYQKDKVLFTCLKCNPACKTCFGSLSAECTSCPNGQYLDGTDIGGGIIVGYCVTQCSQGYYKDTKNMRCLRCNPSANCIDCKDDSPDYCLSCKLKYHLKAGTCYQNCPEGYWNDTPYRLCRPCDEKCSTCQDTPTFCTSCSGDYYFQKNDCFKDSCPNGFYKNKNKTPGKNTCEKCDDTCLTCNSGSYNDCLSCDPVVGFLKGTQCTVCYSNQYGNSKDQTCHLCNSNCATCEGPSENECRNCQGQLLFHQKQCINICPDKTYPDVTNHKCQQCDESCHTCISEGPNNCKSCNVGRFLKNQICQTSCSVIGEYPDQENKQVLLDNLLIQYSFLFGQRRVCGVCSKQCVRCKDGTPQGCLECAEAKYLQDNECVNTCKSNLFGMISTRECHEKCPQGYYGDNQTKTCLQCDPLCPICSASGLDSCSKCVEPLFLDGKQCKERCPLGYFGDNFGRTCKKCNSNCLECMGETEKECTKCGPGKFLGGNECFIKCPNNQYGDMASMSCILDCPQGTFGNQQENICKLCHTNCSQCYGPSYSQCYKCNRGYYNLNGTCDSCPKGYFREDINRTCQPCFENCSACTGGSPTDCTLCTIGNFYLKGKKMCLSTCPAPFYSEDNNPDCVLQCSQADQYPNDFTRKCDICHAACKKCTGPSEYNCQQCQPNYFFVSQMQYCTKKCPNGYFENLITFSCDLCDKSCATCNGNQPDQCTSCVEPKILYQNRCQNDCPYSQFRDEESRICVTSCTILKSNRFPNQNTKKCQNCHSFCQRCTGPTNKECQKCTSPYLKQGQSCLETCPIGYYARYQNNNSQLDKDDCQKCHQNCEDCYGASETECRICAKGFFRLENNYSRNEEQVEKRCLGKCPFGFVPNFQSMACEECPPYTYYQNGSCQQCHYSCLKCNGPLKSDCLECSSDRSVQSEKKPQYGYCNCKQGFMESFSSECQKVSQAVQVVIKSVTVSAITTGCISILSTLISSSTFSLYQIIEISQFTSHFRFVNITFPLNIQVIFDSISTSQPNDAIKRNPSPTFQNKTRTLIDKQELEFMKDVQHSPQLWQSYIFTLLMNTLSWILVFIVNVFVTKLKIKYDNQRILEKLRVMVQYTLPIQVFIRTAQESFQFIFLSFYFTSSLDIFGWLNCTLMSLNGMVVCLIIVRGSFIPIKKKQKMLSEQEDEYIQEVKVHKKNIIQYPHPLRTLWVFFKDTKLCRNYYSILLGLKMIYLLVFVFTNSKVTQLITISATKLIFFLYLVILQPYKYKWYNYVNIFNELLQTLIPITVLILSTSSEDKYQQIGWLLMIQILLLFITNFIYAAFEIVMIIKRFIEKKINQYKKNIQVSDEKQSFNDQSLENSIYKNKNYKKMSITAIEINNNDDDDDDRNSNQITLQKLQLGSKNKSTTLKVLQSNNTVSLNQQSLSEIGEQSQQENQLENRHENGDFKSRVDELLNKQNESIDKNQDKSYAIEDYSIREDNLNYSGFPLAVFGKQFEEKTELRNATRKKKNSKKNAMQNKPNNQIEELNLNVNIDIQNKKWLNKNTQQIIEDEEKVRENKKGLIKEKVQETIEKCEDIQPRKIQLESQLDIVKVLDQYNKDIIKKMINQKKTTSNIQSKSQSKVNNCDRKQESSSQKIIKDSYVIDFEGEESIVKSKQQQKDHPKEILERRKQREGLEKEFKLQTQNQKKLEFQHNDSKKQQIDMQEQQKLNNLSKINDMNSLKDLQKTFYIPRQISNEPNQYHNDIIEQKVIILNEKINEIEKQHTENQQMDGLNQPKSILEFIRTKTGKKNKNKQS